MMRILIIDNNRTFRQSLRKMITRHFPETDVRTLTGLPDYRDLLPQMEPFDPHVTFADMYTFSEHALDFARTVKDRFPGRTLVLMSLFDIPEYRHAAHQNGADFFLLKRESTFEEIAGLITGITKKAEGRGDARTTRDAK